MVAFCSTVQKFHGLFCAGSLGSEHTVSRFQNRICIIESQEKENKFFSINEEMGATTVDSQWFKIQRGMRWLFGYITNKFVQDNVSSSFWMWFFIGFPQKVK